MLEGHCGVTSDVWNIKRDVELDTRAVHDDVKLDIQPDLF